MIKIWFERHFIVRPASCQTMIIRRRNISKKKIVFPPLKFGRLALSRLIEPRAWIFFPRFFRAPQKIKTEVGKIKYFYGGQGNIQPFYKFMWGRKIWTVNLRDQEKPVMIGKVSFH